MNSPLYGERLLLTLTSLFFFLLVSRSLSLFFSSPLKFENGDCRVVSANSTDGAASRDQKWGNGGSGGGVGKNVAIKI